MEYPPNMTSMTEKYLKATYKALTLWGLGGVWGDKFSHLKRFLNLINIVSKRNLRLLSEII